jgi:hypothetical protein
VSGIREQNSNYTDLEVISPIRGRIMRLGDLSGKDVRNMDLVQNTIKLFSGQSVGVCPETFDFGQAC